MNTYNPHIHHRKSIRLKGFDYSQAGLYFVTICCQNRIYRFGDVNNGNMILNEAGVMVKNWYYEIENKFPDIVCHDMIIMPNHFHCIVENVGTVGAVGAVGADLRVCPNNPVDNDDVNNVIGVIIKGEHNQNIKGEHNQNIKGEHNQNIKGEHNQNIKGEHNQNIKGEHIGSHLHRVVQWFKTMTTNEYIRGVKNLGWPPFDGKLWQRNYYEHIIRNKQSYQTISKYINNNPAKWADDKFYTE